MIRLSDLPEIAALTIFLLFIGLLCQHANAAELGPAPSPAGELTMLGLAAAFGAFAFWLLFRRSRIIEGGE